MKGKGRAEEIQALLGWMRNSLQMVLLCVLAGTVGTALRRKGRCQLYSRMRDHSSRGRATGQMIRNGHKSHMLRASWSVFQQMDRGVTGMLGKNKGTGPREETEIEASLLICLCMPGACVSQLPSLASMYVSKCLNDKQCSLQWEKKSQFVLGFQSLGSEIFWSCLQSLQFHSVPKVLYGLFMYELKLIVYGDFGCSKWGRATLLEPWNSFSIENYSTLKFLVRQIMNINAINTNDG